MFQSVSVKLVSKVPRLVLRSSSFPAFCKDLLSGGTRTRTEDTMIFAHVAHVFRCLLRFQKPLI